MSSISHATACYCNLRNLNSPRFQRVLDSCARHTSCDTLGAIICVHSHAITTVSGVVHGVGRVLDRPAGSGGWITAVVLVLRIFLNRMIRTSSVRRSVVADCEIVRPIVAPDRVSWIVKAGRITDATHVRGPLGLVAVRGPAGPYRAVVNVHVVVHVWLLVPEIYGKRWAT